MKIATSNKDHIEKDDCMIQICHKKKLESIVECEICLDQKKQKDKQENHLEMPESMKR